MQLAREGESMTETLEATFLTYLCFIRAAWPSIHMGNETFVVLEVRFSHGIAKLVV